MPYGVSHPGEMQFLDDKYVYFGGALVESTADASIGWNNTSARLQFNGTSYFANAVTFAGALTIAGALNVPGDFSVNTTVFTVNATSGDIGTTGSLTMATDKKILFRDAGIFAHSSADGKLLISSDGTGADDITLSGTVTLDDDLLTPTNKKVQFRDTGIYINSGADGKLTISADGAGTDDITISGTVTLDDDLLTPTTKKIQFRDAGLYIQSSADGKLLISSDGASTDDITLSGTVTLDDNLSTPTDKKVLFRDTGIFIHSTADGKLLISSDGAGVDDITLSGTVTLDDDLITPTDKKIQFRDAGIFIQSSADGKLLISSDGVGADDITLTGDVTVSDNAAITGTLGVTGKASLNGAVDVGSAADDVIQILGTISADSLVGTDKKIQFRDTGLFVQSSADGKLLISSDGAGADDITLSGTVTLDDNLTVPTDKKIILRDTGIFIHSTADGKLLISSDGVGADDITLTGDVTVSDNMAITGTLGVTGKTSLNGAADIGSAADDVIQILGTISADSLVGTDKKVQFRDAGIFVQSSADGKLLISSDGVGADDITLGGTVTVNDNITFATGGARSISVAQATTGLAGNNLSFAAGAALDGALNGGDASLNAGAKSGAGTDGVLNLGTANTSVVNIGITAKNTAIAGTMSVAEKASLNGAVDIGSDAADVVQILGTISADALVGTDKKIQFRDAGLFVQSSADGKLLISSDGAGTDDITLSGTITLDDDLLTPTDKKIQFRDAGIFIQSTADGKLLISSDGVGTDDITLTGNVTVSNDVAVTGASAFNGGAKIPDDITFTFGTDNDVTMQYDENGNDELQFTGAVGFDNAPKLRAGAVVLDAQTLAFGTDSDIVMQYDEADNDVMRIDATATAGVGIAVPDTADGTIEARRLVEVDGAGDLKAATVNSQTVKGILCHNSQKVSPNAVKIGVLGVFPAVADAKIEDGSLLKACYLGRVGRFVNTALAGTTMHTTALAGIEFTNQPANDSITLTAADAGDTGKKVTIIGTTNATDTVVLEQVTLNNGVGVASVKADWGLILAFKVFAADGTTPSTLAAGCPVTETSGGLAIGTIPAGAGGTNYGVLSVVAANQRAFNILSTIESDNATTKQIGVQLTNTADAVVYDSQALNGTTPQNLNTAANKITEIYVGDLEAARTITLKVGAEDDEELIVGKALSAAAAQGDPIAIRLPH